MYSKKCTRRRQQRASQPAAAAPSINDMIGARIEYIYAEPFKQERIVEIGTVKSIKQLRDGRLEMFVVPDNAARMGKYRIAESHLLRYIHDLQAAA